jgi:hypothetical protein
MEVPDVSLELSFDAGVFRAGVAAATALTSCAVIVLAADCTVFFTVVLADLVPAFSAGGLFFDAGRGNFVAVSLPLLAVVLVEDFVTLAFILPPINELQSQAAITHMPDEQHMRCDVRLGHRPRCLYLYQAM